MLEFLFGFMLGSGPSDSPDTKIIQQPKATPGDVYVNGEAIQRVRDPLQVKTACAGWKNFWNDEVGPDPGMTFLDIFKYIYPKDFKNYEILRITRVLSQTNSSASFWFEFIEKYELAPKA